MKKLRGYLEYEDVCCYSGSEQDGGSADDGIHPWSVW